MRKWIIRLVIDIMREWQSEKWFAKNDGLIKAHNLAINEGRRDVLSDPEFVELTPPPQYEAHAHF